MFKLLFRPAFIRAATVNCKSTKIRTVRSVSLFSGLFGATATSKMDSASAPSVVKYTPASWSTSTSTPPPFPYTQQDLTPMDAGNDDTFYAPPRFVTHIDDNAIMALKGYYDKELPRSGVILDFCSSWVSHFPPGVFNVAKRREEFISKREAAAQVQSEGDGQLIVLGTGMNVQELKANPVLWRWSVQDLNVDPEVRLPDVEEEAAKVGKLDAATCVVSIDYLTKPVEVLSSIRKQTNQGGRVHLVISNRCFPTKAVGRWLSVRENERLEMVGDYLWWSGWRDVEIVEVVKGGFLTDPLWVVRGTNIGEGEG